MAKTKLKIEYKPIKDLKPYKNNPRNNDDAVGIVKKSIEEYGFKVPVIIDKNNEVIAGHTRIKAAKELNLKEIPTIKASDLSPEQVKAFRIMDNKSQDYSGWDKKILAEEFYSLKDTDVFDFTGFSNEEISNIWDKDVEEDDFNTKESLKKPKYKVKKGDIYQLGNHRLMCGNAIKEEDVNKLMDGEKADLLLTDPPYNVNYSSKNELLNLMNKGNKVQEPIRNDFLSAKEYIEFSNKWYQNIQRKLKDYNSIYIFGNYESLIGFYDIKNINISNILVWEKNSLILGRMDYKGKHENILYGWKKHHKWYGDNSQTTIWKVDKPLKCELHPTMKPIKLLTIPLKNSTKKEQTIIDPFGGSGSTLIACEQLNRKCFMMELDPVYCSVIIERWEKLTGKKHEKWLKRKEN